MHPLSDPHAQALHQPARELKFEAALAELEAIVQRMEEGNLALEDSIACYQRGSELLKHCRQLLGEAEQKIQILDKETLRDFNVADGEDA